MPAARAGGSRAAAVDAAAAERKKERRFMGVLYDRGGRIASGQRKGDTLQRKPNCFGAAKTGTHGTVQAAQKRGLGTEPYVPALAGLTKVTWPRCLRACRGP